MSNHSDRLPAPAPLPEDTCSALESDAGAVRAVSARASSDERIERTAAIFSAIADPTRLRILEALAVRELCVCDLSEISGISQSGVSHQLRLLRDRGLVAFTRDGNRAVYRLADHHVTGLLAQGFEHADEWVDAR